MSADRYPLAWPPGRPRTPSHLRQRARFKSGWQHAINSLTAELKRLGGRKLVDQAVLSTNVPLRLDGEPRASRAREANADQGVAVYITYKGRQTCFACDRWNTVHDNIYAIAKTIEALRGIDRWGSGDMTDAAFRGFAALPPAGPKPWIDVLGMRGRPVTSLAEVEIRFRELARTNHPDVGGNPDRMAALNQAVADARAELG